MVVATADKLSQNILRHKGKARADQISNGEECIKFDPKSITEEPQYLNWLNEEKIHVGYYGALASWVDYELLNRLAQEQDIHIILIGIEHDDSLEKSGLLGKENV